MENKGWRLTLVHKALILVLIPFVFNGVWLLMLSSELDKSQKLIAMEREQSRFIEDLNTVLKDSYQTRESFVGYIASRSERYLDKADLLISRTADELAQLLARPNLSHDQRVLVSELDEILVHQFKQIRKIIRDSESSKLGLIQEVEPVTGQVEGVLGNYPNTEAHLAKQRKELDGAREEARRSADFVRRTVGFGLCGNLIMAMLLVLAIRADLASRLSALMEKSRRLPQRQPLGKFISGADELSDLDHSLHEAAGELLKAAEFRSALMQMVAHDLRSPLNSCLISVDILERGGGNEIDDVASRQVKAIKSNLDRVVNLTGDLLFLEQFENSGLQLEREPENMQELVGQAVNSVSGLAAARKIEIKNECGRDYVLVDRGRIIQVLVNYLANAVKFSPGQSEVVVSSKQKDGYLSVFVRDCGVGVRPDEQERIFERFYQSKEGRAAGGTGLGLAISKLIAEAHGGSVGVISEPGSGATFWFSVAIQ